VDFLHSFGGINALGLGNFPLTLGKFPLVLGKFPLII